MYQPDEPTDDRGVPGNTPLRSGIRMAVTEGLMWDRLHRKLWPNATVTEREQLRNRIMRSLQADPQGPPMSKTDWMNRVQLLHDRLRNLPPDSNNLLMGD